MFGFEGKLAIKSNECCKKLRMKNVFPDPVAPDTMQVKGCRNLGISIMENSLFDNVFIHSF